MCLELLKHPATAFVIESIQSWIIHKFSESELQFCSPISNFGWIWRSERICLSDVSVCRISHSLIGLRVVHSQSKFSASSDSKDSGWLLPYRGTGALTYWARSVYRASVRYKANNEHLVLAWRSMSDHLIAGDHIQCYCPRILLTCQM